MTWFQTLFGLSSGSKVAQADPEPAEWYVEMKANQARASAFRSKILAALNEQGIPPEIRHHIEPELFMAALLLGVKE